MAKTKSLLPAKLKDAKLLPWSKIVPSSVFKLNKNSRAGVVVGQDGAPHLFLFDTFALLDILSEIDERLVERLSAKDYHSKAINPAGWLIDELESQLPLNPKYVKSLKDAIDEANQKGWVSFSKIQKEFGIV